MPGDLTYFRKFIILKNDHTNIPNISPKGHGRIEMKGNRGTVRINLENCEVEEEYRIYLLREKEGLVEELDLGRIFTDERGRGRTDINISLRDLELKGFPVEKLDAILIRKDENILLSAYIKDGNEAIDKYIKSFGRKEEEKLEEAEPMDKVEVSEDIIEEKEAVEVEEAEDLTKYFPVTPEYGYFQESKKEDPEDVELDQAEEVVKAEEDEGEESEGAEYTEGEPQEEVKAEEVKDYQTPVSSYEYHSYKSLEYMRQVNNKNQMTNYILSVLKYFPQVQPFKIYLHGYTWWRIDDDGSNANRGFLPYYNYLFSANYKYPFLYNATTCMDQILKYGHYLFGLYKEGEEVKYYVYAVPGRFTIDEHPFKGITGFNTWYESIDGVGYWLLYIDPLTGETIYPINPMIPTE